MSNFIIFIVFAALLYFAIAGGVGMIIHGEKGRNKILGFALGACIPIFGIVATALSRPSSEYLIQEAYKRNLLSRDETMILVTKAIALDKKEFSNSSKNNNETQK